MRRSLPDVPVHPRKCRAGRAFWLWLSITMLVMGSAVSLHAAAQTRRASEIISQALASEPNMEDGVRLYRAHCLSCHGPEAHGDARAVVPSIAGQVSSYLIKQLVDIAEGDREVTEMHRVVARAELTSPRALRSLSAYLNRLPPDPTPQHGDGKRLAVGEKTYRASCMQCHGEHGEGDEATYSPALRGLDFSYLLSESRRIAIGHRYSADISAIELLEGLSLEQLTAVADFASRLPLPPQRTFAANQLSGSMGEQR